MNKVKPRCILLALTLCLCYATVEAQKWGKVSAEEWEMGPPDDYPEANAIVLFDKGVLEVSTRKITFYRHVRIKVFNQAGAEEAGDISFTYHDGDKISGFKAHTLTPDGRKHKVKKRQVNTKKVGDTRIKTFSFPSIEPGSILEYKYKNVNRRYSILDPWYFQHRLYTVVSTFTLKLAPGFTYSSLSSHMPTSCQKAVMGEDPLTEVRSFTWTMKNLYPIKDEPYMSSFKDFASALHCQLVSYQNPYQRVDYIKNWPDLGKRFTEYIDGFTDKQSCLTKQLSELNLDTSDQLSLLQTIYTKISKNIKVKGSGEGSYISHEHLCEVLEEGAGTRDEKNIILVEMAKKAGLSAWPVLISTRSHGRVNPDIYQLQQFNHIIAFVEIDSGAVFLDAASEYCPFGMLPANCLSPYGFLIDGDKSQIVRLKTPQPRTYRLDVTTVNLAPDGGVRCTTVVQLSGYFAISYCREYEQQKPEDFFDTYFMEKLDMSYDLKEYDFNYDDVKNRCQFTFCYVLPDYAKQTGGNIFLAPIQFSFRENPFTSEKRFFPVDFGYPFTYHNIVKIAIGDSLTAAQLPADTVFDIGSAHFVRQASSDGDWLTIDSRMEITKPVFIPQVYQKLRRFFTRIADAAAEEVVLSLK
jgi:hypothetical protein